MMHNGSGARDEVKPIDPVKAILKWRRRGFSDPEIIQEVRWEKRSSRERHPATHAGCVAILEKLEAR